MRIKHWVVSSMVAIFVMLLCNACEWSTGGAATGWDERYNWVSFAGTYRGVAGGALVTDYTTTPGTPATTNSVRNSRQGTTENNKGAYGGSLHPNIVPGTVQITIGGLHYADSAGDGRLVGGAGGEGHVEYKSGRWDVDLKGALVEGGKTIVASYSYSVGGSDGSTGAGSGVSGAAIYSFVIWQTGNLLQITDNNGRVYEGRIGSVSGTLNPATEDGSPRMPAVGDSVLAQFSAKGVSAAGFQVKIAGTLQGTVGGSDEIKYMTSRRMFGTWIEEGGRTGDINGQASPIRIVADAGGGGADDGGD